MIDIKNIRAGWANLYIGNYVFCASYLSDVVHELNRLFSINIFESRKVVLEGEDKGDLTLVSYITFGNVNNLLPMSKQRDDDYGYILNIICQDNHNISIIKYPYTEFMEEYKQMKAIIKPNYIKNFLCPQDEEEYKYFEEHYND